MATYRQRVLKREILKGTFINLGSSITVEIAGKAGFDWLLIDLEHGVGDHETLVHQLQATGNTNAEPFVRIAANETPRYKRVLDLGARGVMVPWVSNVEEAELAVISMRYPPQGIRGVASLNRACQFGQDFDNYYATANEELVTVVQIETVEAVENAGAMAAIDGIDVLFVGPTDLTTNYGISRQFDHPTYREAVAKVNAACISAGKAAGILLANTGQIKQAKEDGFTFIAVGSDGGVLANGMKNLVEAF